MNKKSLISALMPVFLSIAVFLIQGCSTMQSHWKETESLNTIEAYEEFLEKYPKGMLADQARSKIEEIYFLRAQVKNTIESYKEFLERHPVGKFTRNAKDKIMEIRYKQAVEKNRISDYAEFLKNYPEGQLTKKVLLRLKEVTNEDIRNAKAIKIMVEQFYEESKDFSLPFEDVSRRLFEYAGLRVVNSDSNEYELALNIEVRGRPLKAEYKVGWTRKWLYTGVNLSGKISLEIRGIPIYVEPFSINIDPPDEDTIFTWARSPQWFILFSSPSKAPFVDAFWKSGFLSKMYEILIDIYGSSFLVTALKDEYSMIEIEAVDRLVNMGNQAVELLIPGLKDEDYKVRRNAAWALWMIEDPRAVESLIVALKDEDENVKRYAAWALEAITGKTFGEDHKKWKKWWEENKEDILKKK